MMIRLVAVTIFVCGGIALALPAVAQERGFRIGLSGVHAIDKFGPFSHQYIEPFMVDANTTVDLPATIRRPAYSRGGNGIGVDLYIPLRGRIGLDLAAFRASSSREEFWERTFDVTPPQATIGPPPPPGRFVNVRSEVRGFMVGPSVYWPVSDSVDVHVRAAALFTRQRVRTNIFDNLSFSESATRPLVGAGMRFRVGQNFSVDADVDVATQGYRSARITLGVEL